jgi:hypothetical protein
MEIGKLLLTQVERRLLLMKDLVEGRLFHLDICNVAL